MKHLNKRILSIFLLLALVCSVLLPTEVSAASRKIITTPTGYDSADDVEYQRTSGTIHNWGARGEDCVFLSTYALQFYTGSNTYDVFSDMSGSKTQGDVPSSQLYKALQSFLKATHTHETTYGETRYEYCYTDCVSNDTSMISSFYSGEMFKSTWDAGNTWNREHIWPASKSLSGRPSNGDDGEGADIMMLRPTLKSENGSRGNKAFGVSSGFQDPGVDVRGDCARIVLYVYVRWGNTSNMWGSGGVIENQNILFQWMQEDPVDTWEMGRNDSVQSITGTRNVFVDYPELAFTLFGREIPNDMTTPSGEAKNSTPDTSCTHSNTEVKNKKSATCTEEGYTGDTYCKDCDKKVSSGSKISATGHKNENGDAACDVCGAAVACSHKNTEIRDAKDATCTEEGYTGDTYCTDCGDQVSTGERIEAGAHDAHVENAKDATCTEEGYTGDVICHACQTTLLPGEVTPATGRHSYGDWIENEDGSQGRICSSCGYVETKDAPAPKPTEPTQDDANNGFDTTVIIIAACVVAGIAVIAVLIIVIVKKRKKVS